MRAFRLPAALRPRGLLGLLLGLAGCTPTGSNYYPLEAPRWWYYEVRQTILDEARDSRYMMMNAGAGQLGGEAVFLQSAQTGSLDYLRYRGDGVERLASLRPGMPAPLHDERAHIILPEHLEEGAVWRVRSTLGLIESRTFDPLDRLIVRRIGVDLEKKIVARELELELPAGRFDHCLQVNGAGQVLVPTDRGTAEATVAVHSSEWYAPGVGLVRLERTETSDSAFLKSGRQIWQLADFGKL